MAMETQIILLTKQHILEYGLNCLKCNRFPPRHASKTNIISGTAWGRKFQKIKTYRAYRNEAFTLGSDAFVKTIS